MAGLRKSLSEKDFLSDVLFSCLFTKSDISSIIESQPMQQDWFQQVWNISHALLVNFSKD